MNNFYLIGLTGHLGSGKSTVRRMLEKLGARGIDADAVARVAMERGTPIWFSIVDKFGADLLQFNGEINREKLGARVFTNGGALQALEAILHPAVEHFLREMLREEQTPVVVIEAIKLIESGLHHRCDAVWVVTSVPEVQLERVMRDRRMRYEDARARLDAQGSLDEKLRLATVVIDNSGDEEATRAQVEQAWQAIQPQSARDKSEWLLGLPHVAAPPSTQAAPAPVPSTQVAPAPVPVAESEPEPPQVSEAPIELRRARRTDLAALGVALAQRAHRTEPLPRAEVVKRFGESGYRIAVADNRIVAFAAWDAENLVAVVREVWAESAEAAARALPQLFTLIENDASSLQCEVVVLLIDQLTPAFVAEQARADAYEPKQIDTLYRVWRQVAEDRLQAGDQIWLKRLREGIITKPV